jgi:hypothetical protein
MEARSSLNPSIPAKDSEFTFHLIGKKTAKGSPGAVVGAIVAGPVTSMVDDALGTAFDPGGDTHTSKSAKKSPAAKKTSDHGLAKPASKRRRRGPQQK